MKFDGVSVSVSVSVSDRQLAIDGQTSTASY